MDPTTGSHPGPGQAVVSTELSLGKKGALQAASAITSRFDGAGIRYKAKLIGVDPVPDAQGEKMCWDTMMKLKGCEAAARRQGKHKLRVWLNVSSSGLKIMDERTGAVLYDHDRSKISCLTKDDSDPRALAYIYEYQDSYSLFYIKMANLAGPVIADIDVVCQGVNLQTHQEPSPSEEPTHTNSLLLLDNAVAPPVVGSALEDVLSLEPSLEQPCQVPPSSDLMEVFTIQAPAQSLCDNQPIQPASPQPKFSNSQILSIFPQNPVGGTPYFPPQYPPTAMAWGQQGLLGNPWRGPAVGPWPTLPTGTWANAGVQSEAHGCHPGVMNKGITPPTPSHNASIDASINHAHPPNVGPDLLQ